MTTRAEKFETGALVVILVTVGGFAGAASFRHVHDWTMLNSPQGTGGWFGWANAVISELVPIAALLVMRRRRRAGQSIAYPAFLLLLALALSVTAQLAVAKAGLFGGIVSVVPALAFAGLAKLILGKTSAPTPATEMHHMIVPDARDDRPEVVPTLITHRPQQTDTPQETIIAQFVEKSDWPKPPVPAHLIDTARQAAQEHHSQTGRAITRDELQRVLRVSNGTTGEVMKALDLNASHVDTTLTGATR